MLEVTSPGLERPLKTAAAVKEAVGKYVHVKLYQAIDKAKVFEGTLLSFDGEDLIIQYMDKTRKKEEELEKRRQDIQYKQAVWDKAANIAKYDFTSHTQLPPDSS